MHKFCVYKGKAGYDFYTLADSEAKAKDIAWRQYVAITTPVDGCGPLDPFSWWEKMTKQWGNDKWYVNALHITEAAQEKPKSVNKEDE